MIEIGTVLGGKYEVLKKIGQGGMSVVYMAMDLRLNKYWAVKEIKRTEVQDTHMLLKSLQMEATVLKQVDHPVLPRIVDIIDFDETVFVVMDYVEGHPLSEILREKGAQPQEQVIGWAKDLCGALQYLHSLKPPIIYRDMKPSNIMVKPDGTVKLIDFGTAKELDSGNLADTMVLGTRGYAAPEQFGDVNGRGIHKTDERTDIYSLGATLYHVVTGQDPGESPYGIKPIRMWNPALSGGLEKIILKCTMPDPKDRYQSCSELKYALEHYQELDDVYKKACLKKLKCFFVSAGFTICFALTAVAGGLGIKRERKAGYDQLMTEGYHHILKGEYEEAAATYVNALTNVDGKRDTAYVELLKLYINYLDEPETGLSRVTYYINQGYCGIDRNQDLLLQVALSYFDVVKDYKTSAVYFDRINKDKYPAASHYAAIAKAMSDLNVDYKKLFAELSHFEEENDGLAISDRRLMNYRLLCVVYSRCMNQMENADEGLVRVAEKGLDLLEQYENDSIKAEYYTIYNQYMAQGYEHMGARLMESYHEQAGACYERALSCCDMILGMVSDDTGETVPSISDTRLREAKYCQKAEILTVLSEYEKALKVYEKAEQEYGDCSISLYVGHLSLLCRLQEQITTDVEQWDYSLLADVYKNGSKIQGIRDDYRWKQLEVKLAPLFEKNGGF